MLPVEDPLSGKRASCHSAVRWIDLGSVIAITLAKATAWACTYPLRLTAATTRFSELALYDEQSGAPEGDRIDLRGPWLNAASSLDRSTLAGC